jgi:hypothetical protein
MVRVLERERRIVGGVRGRGIGGEKKVGGMESAGWRRGGEGGGVEIVGRSFGGRERDRGL